MFNKVLISAVGLSAMASFGCGGSSNAPANPFAGNFTGTWTKTPLVNPEPPENTGAVMMQVSKNGKFSGSWDSAHQTGTVSGTVDSSGKMIAKVIYAGKTYSIGGTVAWIPQNGNPHAELKGDLEAGTLGVIVDFNKPV